MREYLWYTGRRSVYHHVDKQWTKVVIISSRSLKVLIIKIIITLFFELFG